MRFLCVCDERLFHAIHTHDYQFFLQCINVVINYPYNYMHFSILIIYTCMTYLIMQCYCIYVHKTKPINVNYCIKVETESDSGIGWRSTSSGRKVQVSTNKHESQPVDFRHPRWIS